jgi:hypothetical protein
VPGGSAKIEVMDDNEELGTAEPDIQDLIARWAGDSKRLLIVLPGVLAKLEDLGAETEAFRQRLGDLERENHALRQSRDELAETFAKLKGLIAEMSITAAVADLDGPQPRPAQSPAASPAPMERDCAIDDQDAGPRPAHHVRSAAGPPVSSEPSPRVAAREDKAEPAPSSVRYSSGFRRVSRS